MRLEKGDGAMLLNNMAKALGILDFAERLGEVVPEVEIVNIEDTIKPMPKRARVRRKRNVTKNG